MQASSNIESDSDCSVVDGDVAEVVSEVEGVAVVAIVDCSDEITAAESEFDVNGLEC